MSNHSDNNWIIPTSVLIVCGIALLLTWKFSQTFGLDFSTGAAVLIRLVLFTAIWIATIYFTPISIKNTWPIVLSSFWFSWWPALDFWSNANGLTGFSQLDSVSPAWYAMWYTKWSVSIAIIAGGYTVRAWLDR